MTYTPHKFRKLREEWLSLSSMKWKFLNMGFPEHNGRTVCLLGRNEGWDTVPHRQWQIVRNKNLNSIWSPYFNFWMGISSCERLNCFQQSSTQQRRPQSSSEKAVLRVISEQTCLSSTASISSLSSFPPCSMRKHIDWGYLGRLKILSFFESTAKDLFALLEAFSGNKKHHCKTLFLYH